MLCVWEWDSCPGTTAWSGSGLQRIGERGGMEVQVCVFGNGTAVLGQQPGLDPAVVAHCHDMT